MLTTLDAATLNQFGLGKDRNWETRLAAGHIFDQVLSQAKRGQLWARLIGKPSNLPGAPHLARAAQRTMGTVVVPLSKIVGTEGRSGDFDAEFRPLNANDRERWINIAAARLREIALPAVELIQVGEEYYVRDGHHRISVARAFGQVEIDARLVN